MNDYIKSLEEQNEELKQLLTQEQLKVINFTSAMKLYDHVWEEQTIPTQQNSDSREGYCYVYGGKLCTYAS